MGSNFDFLANVPERSVNNARIKNDTNLGAGSPTGIRDIFGHIFGNRRNNPVNNDNVEIEQPPDKGRLLSDLLDEWLNDFQKNVLAENTFTTYRHLIETNINPIIGNEMIADLETAKIQRFINQLLKTGGKLQNGLSTATVRKIYNILNGAFKHAVGCKYLSENPVNFAKQPKLVEKKIVCLEEDEIKMFLEYLYNDKDDKCYYLIFLVAFHTGIRRGELFGLPWDAIDRKNCSLSIHQQLSKSEGHGHYIKDTLKTVKSRRKVFFDESLLEEFDKHRIDELEKFTTLGWTQEKIDDHFQKGLVFTNTVGKPFDFDNIKRAFARLLVKAGITKKVTFHSARHSYASICLRNQTDLRTLADQLGHSDPSLLLERYSHSNEQSYKESSAKLHKVLNWKDTNKTA